MGKNFDFFLLYLAHVDKIYWIALKFQEIKTIIES